MESQGRKEPSLRRASSIPFNARASFKRMEMKASAPHRLQREKFKRIKTRKEVEGKIEDNTLSLQGNLKKAIEALAKAQMAMGITKGVMAQVEAPHHSLMRSDSVLMACTSSQTSQAKRKAFT